METQSKMYQGRSFKTFNKFPSKQLPVPPPGVLAATPEAAKPRFEDKLAELRTQRRAQGLCMKCGGKWGRNHKCPDKIDLHVLEEYLALMPTESPEEPDDHSTDDSSDGEVFSLSHNAAIGIQGKKTIRLAGKIADQDILILIDSGSSITFISESAVTRLNCKVQSVEEIQVSVASGAKLQSNLQVSNISW